MSAGTEVRAAIPGMPAGRDVMISEILPEPQPGGSRYIEVYNNSINPLDLSDLQLRYTPGTDSATGESRPLAAESFIIFPGDFVALCTDDTDVKARYYTPDPNLVISMESMPAFSKESGKIGSFTQH